MSNIKGPDVGYVDLLNHETTEYLKKEQAEGRQYQKTPIRPSAAGKCTRELYYELMQYSKKARYDTEVSKPEVHRLLNLGHSIEYHIVRQFEQHLKMLSVKYKQQTLCFGEVGEGDLKQMLEGSLDICLWSDEWKCVVDFKSKKDKFSSFRSTNWDETSEKLGKMRSVETLTPSAFWVPDLDAFLDELHDPFFEANFLQLNLYLNSDFIKDRGGDHAAIIQYNKNDSRLREIRFAPSQTLFDKVKGKFNSAVSAVVKEDTSLAPKDYLLGSMKCAFCSFKKECWNEDTLKAWFKTFGKKKWPTEVAKLAQAEALEALYSAYTGTDAALAERDQAEESIIKLLTESGENRVKFSTGDVYDVVAYKSPRPHFALKRSKL